MIESRSSPSGPGSPSRRSLSAGEKLFGLSPSAADLVGNERMSKTQLDSIVALPDRERDEAIIEYAAALAADGVQSLLLEGGPTLAAAFLDADLVDKLLVFVAPALAGSSGLFAARLASPRHLARLSARMVGEDALLEAYVHEP